MPRHTMRTLTGAGVVVGSRLSLAGGRVPSAYNHNRGGSSMGGELTRGFRAFLIVSGLLYSLIVVLGWLVGGA